MFKKIMTTTHPLAKSNKSNFSVLSTTCQYAKQRSWLSSILLDFKNNNEI
jgi:hypothetical protein